PLFSKTSFDFRAFKVFYKGICKSVITMNKLFCLGFVLNLLIRLVFDHLDLIFHTEIISNCHYGIHFWSASFISTPSPVGRYRERLNCLSM
ncbi:hypothetical protein J4714_12710, partial [Staphylococcus epidermidis]|nr:hypothetical protein [Staphylococcus epidermidis]